MHSPHIAGQDRGLGDTLGHTTTGIGAAGPGLTLGGARVGATGILGGDLDTVLGVRVGVLGDLDLSARAGGLYMSTLLQELGAHRPKGLISDLRSVLDSGPEAVPVEAWAHQPTELQPLSGENSQECLLQLLQDLSEGHLQAIHSRDLFRNVL